MRCFLAVPLQDPALGDVQHLLATLTQRVAGVRWVRPETPHITVHFFGSIDDDDVQRALGAVSPVAAATSPSELTLDTLGAFPPRGWPRVLWFGCKEDPAGVISLAERCRASLKDSGFEVEARRFRAHCTLGRPRVPWSSAGRAAWEAARADGWPATSCVADRLVLYESHPGPGGSMYEVRAALPFAA
ncbi:MAG TPA: RNA 2',3'-cyclic phosphodiesterase [Candidatus Dormibacteraeota bacterium]|nr:RNA 2',3'-cyclic phosphodiesterase [Candidatus Dormibacteraeota bacterium]